MENTLHSTEKLLIGIELSNSKWLLAFSNGAKIRRKSIDARDLKRFMQEVALAKEKLGLSADAPSVACYEAGRDGFWIYRWLTQSLVECFVIDPASIETNRRKRRVKTDRIDAQSMVRKLAQYLAGESNAWAVVRVPSEEEEDELRLHREMERLKKEQTGHLARIKSLLILHGIKEGGSLKKLGSRLDKLCCWNGKELQTELKEEIRRELDRLALIREQLRVLQAKKSETLEHPQTNADHQIRDLMKLRGVGEVSAWVLGKEFFGWRTFRNRREVASLAGLTPSPYNSGSSVVEQGISKAGNKRIRRVMIELAWAWLRFQPESELTHWFIDRYGSGGKRARRIGIVAVARKLLVALWKYVEFGEVPKGAIVK